MDSLSFTYFLPLLLFELLFFYLIVVRKNAFEERLALFSPTRTEAPSLYAEGAQLPQVFQCYSLNNILPPSVFFYNLDNQRKI